MTQGDTGPAKHTPSTVTLLQGRGDDVVLQAMRGCTVYMHRQRMKVVARTALLLTHVLSVLPYLQGLPQRVMGHLPRRPRCHWIFCRQVMRQDSGGQLQQDLCQHMTSLPGGPPSLGLLSMQWH